MRREAFLFVFWLPLASSLTAAEPLRVDRFGDPLPDGAIFRLGTIRFRPASTHGEFALSPNGKVFATGDDGNIRLWDTQTGRPSWSRRLPSEMKCDRLLFAPDGQRLMVVAWELGRGTNAYTGFQFDTSSGDSLKSISPPKTSLGTRYWPIVFGTHCAVVGNGGLL